MSSSLSRIIFLTLSSLVFVNIFTYEYKEDLMVPGELLMDVDVIAHYSLTDYVAFKEKSLTILSNLAFWDESYLHFCFNIFKIANCKISPIYYTAWKLICCYKYFKAFSGLLLFRSKNAFLLVDKSVYLRSNC